LYPLCARESLSLEQARIHGLSQSEDFNVDGNVVDDMVKQLISDQMQALVEWTRPLRG